MTTEATNVSPAEEHVQKAKQTLASFTQNTSRALGSLIPTNALQQLTTRKYTLPDKTVASQVLMYRQLLHTNAKPGLKLSRPYQGTAAQVAVKHMPWWEQGIEDTRRMVISYDNLIVRLWLNGAILPYTDLLDNGETMIDEKGLPPVPHPYWVDRLGFQQPDPVTDFRSGGVLSLGMMVHMVENCADIVQRFGPDGDAAVLPFGLTCINVTDMMAKFLMLAKSVDRMDALLSQKPFWRMFADPNAILALQELSMTMLCDVVVELGRERKLPSENKNIGDNLHGEQYGNVRLFSERRMCGM
jgi:ELMO/CED-12 family